MTVRPQQNTSFTGSRIAADIALPLLKRREIAKKENGKNTFKIESH